MSGTDGGGQAAMRPGARLDMTWGDYALFGRAGDMVTLTRQGSGIVASVIWCEKRDGWWHDADAPLCADAAVFPGCRAALLAAAAGDPGADGAILAMLPEDERA